jgi:hypothetical protein
VEPEPEVATPAVAEEVFDLSEVGAGTLPDSYFTETPIEEIRTMIRERLSERLAKVGQETVRNEIKEFTNKIRVTDFDANDCLKAYRFWEGK